jgi:hypothetical protein
MFQNYSELYLAVTSHTIYTTALQAPPERDGPRILICSCITCRRSKILKISITEDSNPNGGGNPVQVTLTRGITQLLSHGRMNYIDTEPYMSAFLAFL